MKQSMVRGVSMCSTLFLVLLFLTATGVASDDKQVVIERAAITTACKSKVFLSSNATWPRTGILCSRKL
jgi:hypothetical protein